MREFKYGGYMKIGKWRNVDIYHNPELSDDKFSFSKRNNGVIDFIIGGSDDMFAYDKIIDDILDGKIQKIN